MKSAGTNPDLWFIEIGDKSGFVNKQFLKETKILSRKPKFEIELEEALQIKNEVQPDKVQKAHEVFEGTTIYTTEPVSVAEKNTEPPFLPTVSPDFHHDEELSAENSLDIDNTVPKNDPNEENEDYEDDYLEEEEILSKDNIQVQKKIEMADQEDILTKNIPEEMLPQPSKEETNNIEGIVTSSNTVLPDNNMMTTNEPIDGNSNKLENENIQLEDTNGNNHEIDFKTEDITKSELSENKSSDMENSEESNADIKETTKNEFNDIPIQEYENKMQKNTNMEESIIDINTTEEVTLQDGAKVPSEDINNISNAENILIQPEIPKTPIIENLENVNKQQQLTKELKNDNIVSQNINSDDISDLDYEEDDDLNDNDLNDIENKNTDVNTEQNADNTWETSTKTLLPIFHEEPLTIPPKFNTESPLTSTLDPNDMSNTQTQQQTKDNVYIEEESKNDNNYSPNENILNEIPDNNNDIPISTTELPQNEQTDSLLSNIYSGIADVWPSTTEQPKSIYNHEDYPPFEKEKVDGEGSFSFINHILSSLSFIIGGKDQSKALFTSTGMYLICFYLFIICLSIFSFRISLNR